MFVTKNRETLDISLLKTSVPFGEALKLSLATGSPNLRPSGGVAQEGE